MTNQNAYDIKREINLFKAQMKEVNQLLSDYDDDFKSVKEKVSQLRESFAFLVRIMNHELIEALTKANKTMRKLENI